MAKLWARPVHSVLILAEGVCVGGGGGGGGRGGPPWPYARSAPGKESRCLSIIILV